MDEVTQLIDFDLSEAGMSEVPPQSVSPIPQHIPGLPKMECFLELRRPLNLGVVPQRIGLSMKGNKVVIGRGSRADVFLYAGEHPSFVSREHARLDFDEHTGRWLISDLESVNGMFYNSVKLGKNDRIPLTNGDRVYFGNPQHSFFVEYEFIAVPKIVMASPVSAYDPTSNLDYGSDTSCTSAESQPQSPTPFTSSSSKSIRAERNTSSSSSSSSSSSFSAITSTFPVEEIHDDIWYSSVFKFLDINEIHCAAQTCRAWSHHAEKCMETMETIRWRHPWSVESLVLILRKRCEGSSHPVRKIITEGCYRVRDDHVEQIARLCGRFLEHLDFSGTPTLTPRGMRHIAEHCPNLKTLIVRGCKRVGGANWEWMDTLGAHGNLEYCDLHCAGANDTVVTKLARLCPKLRRVDLGIMCTDGVTDAGLLELTEHCPLLEHVDLRGCKRIQDGGVALLVQKFGKNLKTLVLHSCDIGDDALMAIGQYCSSLEMLDLHRCVRITNYGIDALMTGEAEVAKTLRQLDLSNLLISDEGLAHLSKARPPLTVLDLRSCRFITGAGLNPLIKTISSTLLKLDLNGCALLKPIDIIAIGNVCKGTLQELEIGARGDDCITSSWSRGEVSFIRDSLAPKTRVHDAFDFPIKKITNAIQSVRASS